MYSFPYLEPVHFSMSGSNCCFLTCIQISQEAVKVVCYWIYSLFFLLLFELLHIMSKILWNKINFTSKTFPAVQWLRLCFFNPWLGIMNPKAMRHSNNDNKKFLLILTVFNSDYMCIIGSNCFFLLHFLAHSSEGHHTTHMPI